MSEILDDHVAETVLHLKARRVLKVNLNAVNAARCLDFIVIGPINTSGNGSRSYRRSSGCSSPTMDSGPRDVDAYTTGFKHLIPPAALCTSQECESGCVGLDFTSNSMVEFPTDSEFGASIFQKPSMVHGIPDENIKTRESLQLLITMWLLPASNQLLERSIIGQCWGFVLTSNLPVAAVEVLIHD